MRYLPLIALLLAGLVGTQTPEAQTPETTDLSARWHGPPRWLTGNGYQGETFDDGASRGRRAVGANSTVTAAGDIPVVVRFDRSDTTRAGQAIFSTGRVATGGRFYGSAWDVSNSAQPRRLNVLLFEATGGDGPAPDSVWNPVAVPTYNRDVLYVMASSYDGTGATYLNKRSGSLMDVLYVLELRVADGHTLYEDEPAELRLAPTSIRSFTALHGNEEAVLSWTYERPEGTAFRLYRETAERAAELVTILPLSARTYTDAGLQRDTTYYYHAEVLGTAGDVLDIGAEARVRPDLSQGLQLIGHLNPRPFLDEPEHSYYDVWGYVAPDGREYALLCAFGRGLSVIDLSGESPVEVGFYASAGHAQDVETYGVYAYLGHDGSPIEIVDLTDPAHPVRAATLDTQPGNEIGGAHTLTVAGDYLYIAGSATPGGLRIFDLAADPVHPPFVGSFQPFYYHDYLVRGDTLYAAGINGDGVDILDLTDRTAPQRIATITYPASGSHNVCSTTDGSYIFVGDEVGPGRWTRVFDVRDPEDVELVAEIILDPNGTVHNCYVLGDRLFIAHYELGLRVFDIADPAAPEEIGYYDTCDAAVCMSGAFSAYPFLPSRRVLVSDMQGGLYVFRVDGDVATSPPPHGAEALTLAVAPNPAPSGARLTFRLPDATSVRLAVYDALGREVAVLAEGPHAAGPHEVALDAHALAPGVYLARLTAGDRSATARLTVTR